MTTADRCVTISANNEAMEANVPEVYAAGQNSMVDESKLLPTTVSGSYISLDDVSEVPHEVSCKVESINLCKEQVSSGYYYDNGGAGSSANARYVKLSPIAAEPLTTYTFSTNLPIYSLWYYNANGGISSIRVAINTYAFTFTTPDNCTELRVSLHNTNGMADATAFEYAMLNRGDTALPYTHYVSPENVEVTKGGVEENEDYQTLIPNADGTVDAMTSVSPYMNIFTDTEGVNIEVTYNKSWGMQEAQERFYSDFQRGVINHSISFEWLMLSKESITSIVNALSDSATGQTITFKKSAKEAAFTDTEWTELIATKPNWALALL